MSTPRASGRAMVVTELAPAGAFWEAEPEHQDYLQRFSRGLYLPLRPARLEAAGPGRRAQGGLIRGPTPALDDAAPVISLASERSRADGRSSIGAIDRGLRRVMRPFRDHPEPPCRAARAARQAAAHAVSPRSAPGPSPTPAAHRWPDQGRVLRSAGRVEVAQVPSPSRQRTAEAGTACPPISMVCVSFRHGTPASKAAGSASSAVLPASTLAAAPPLSLVKPWSVWKSRMRPARRQAQPIPQQPSGACG